MHGRAEYENLVSMSTQADAFFEELRHWGAGDASCARLEDGPQDLPFAVSIAVRLSDAVVDEIAGEPTYTYFHHYRTANAFLDHLAFRAGLYLQERGARCIQIAASQSVPATAGREGSPFEGRYSHKKAACAARMGSIGRSSLFLHRTWGPRVRLVTVFTDWSALADVVNATEAVEPLQTIGPVISDRCASCTRCADSCPAGAIGLPAIGNSPAFDPEKCSSWMKKAYQHIGRGAVCGICMRVCPSVPAHP